MPHAFNGETRIYWRSDGKRSLPMLVLGNSLGMDVSLWDPVMPRLMRHFHVIRFDMRGHGASDAPHGNYTLAQLTDDLGAVVEAAGLERFHYCGVSLGGMVGMAYAQRANHRLDKLVLSNTAVQFSEDTWTARIERVMRGGMPEIVDGVLDRFFTPAFRARADVDFKRVRETLLCTERHGFAGCCAAIRDMSIADGLARISVPTLVVTGSEDQVTPPARGAEIAAAIPGAQLAGLSGAHIPMTELPVEWGDVVLAFLVPGTNIEQEVRDESFELKSLFDAGRGEEASGQ